MNRAKNIYWDDNLLKRQRVLGGTLNDSNTLPALKQWGRAVVGTRAEVRQRGGVIPSWVPLIAIMLAMTFLCATAIMRTRASLEQARERHASESLRVAQVRQDTAALRVEVQRLQHDPAAVADAAHQYGLIRPNEKVVTLR